MNFFARQEMARRSTGRLLVLYGVAVLGIIAAVHFLFAGLLTQGGDWLNPEVAFFSIVGTLAVILIGVAVGKLNLSSGGRAVAEMCGGRPVEPGTRDPAERRFLNVVEEMSIASGVPLPGVFVLDEEMGINAFAAGHSTDDYAVAVSRGCLEQLSRDELQGVVAHEFSHILNGDMVRNIRLTGWLYGIMGLALLGRVLFEIAARSGRSRSKDSNQITAAIFIFGLGLVIIGWIGQFFARAIQAAISRQREFLADASAVQFTRNPDGIGGALKKIAGYTVGSAIAHPRTSAVSHMFFASALNSFFATHPPLEERIRLLDPQFNPEIAEFTSGSTPSSGSAAAAAFVGEVQPILVQPKKIIPRSRSLKPAQLEHAGRLLAALPSPLAVAVQEPVGASAAVYAMLLAADSSVRERQLAALRQTSTPVVLREMSRLQPHIAALPPRTKLPLVTLATAALRRLSPAQYTEFRFCVDALIEADSAMDLFEYALKKNLCRHLAPHFEPLPPPRLQVQKRIAPLLPDCALLLSCLAHLGHDHPDAQVEAFQAGIGIFGAEDDAFGLLPLAKCNLAQVDAALDRLATASDSIKHIILEASATTVAADDLLREREIELLRAIGDTLDCPIPPFVQLD